MTHPIVEAGARAFHALEHVDLPGWLSVPVAEREDYNELAQATILAALNMMRSEIRIRETLLLGSSTTTLTLALLIQGYVDAVIREIEG